MSVVNPHTHNASVCKACNAHSKRILMKIRDLIKELQETNSKEEEKKEDERCILINRKFTPPLITFPEDPRPEENKTKYLVMEKTTPVWERRRYPSKELVAGNWTPCTCSRSYGLPEDCQRLHCRGRPGCFTSPPSCPASRRWAKAIDQQQIDTIISTYGADKIQPCDKHNVWDPNCHLCRFYVLKINKMMSSMKDNKFSRS